MNLDNLKGKVLEIDPKNISKTDIEIIEETIELLDRGQIRVAEKLGNSWEINEWIRDAIMLYFSIRNLKEINAGELLFYDKLEPKKNYKELKIRVVPPGAVRYGAF